MKKDEARNLIYAGLRKILPDPGFRLSKAEGAFIRKIPAGLQKIFVPLFDYNPEYVFSLTVGIRIDAVEEIFNRVSGADVKGQKLTLTTITPLDYFTSENRKEFRVTTPAEIEASIAELSGIIDREILPFLDQYQNIQSLDSAVNSERESKFDSSILISRAMHSIILARLSGNRRTAEIIKDFSKQIESFAPFDKDRFERLASILNDDDSD